MKTIERQTFQYGWIVRKARNKGPDVWVLRWREGNVDKSRTLGTTQQLRTKAEAQRAASKFTVEINNSIEVATFGQLVRRYLQEAIPERQSTAGPLRSMLNARVLPEWENVRVVDMAKDPMAVEQWIKGLQTRPRKKAKTPRSRSQKQAAYSRSDAPALRVCDALALSGLSAQPDGPDRTEGDEQAGSADLPGNARRVLHNPLSSCSTRSAHGGSCHEYRDADQ